MEAAVQPVPQKPVVPSSVLGMMIFATAEVMFFAGLISAFTIIRSRVMPELWPPPGQPRLPAEATALNTAALLLSGALLVASQVRFRRAGPAASPLVLASLALGAVFVGLQGYEWVKLLGQGLTMTSSSLGSFFYLIVGTHGVHAVVALLLLAWAWLRLRRDALSPSRFYAVQALWYFVVGMWPIIYARVYF